MTEWRWLEAFTAQLEACALSAGEVVAVLSESASRRELVDTSRLAAQRLGGQVVDVVVPTPANPGPVPIRSTGASVALQGNRAAVAALAAADLVIDCTVEGLIHAPELGAILGGGARVLMISNEHPESFERFAFDPTLAARVERGVELLRAAARMRVTSPHGTELEVTLADAFIAGSTGVVTERGGLAHWPGGLCVCYPARGCVQGTVVLAPGDLNLTFKSYVREAVTLRIEDDHVVAVEGDGLDADLLRSHLAAFGERDAYAVSHVGWGMNTAARWDYLPLYDRSQHNGTEARAFAGNVLFSTGANENAGRFTRAHFDLPLRGCTVTLDGRPVVQAGVLVPELE
jgi:2,5-dihydroxypyridine 5,6-dioxygenase